MRSVHRSQHPRHLAGAAASAGLVLLLHGWLLTGLQPTTGSARGETARAARSVQVRQLTVAPAEKTVAEPPVSPPSPLSPRSAQSPAPLVPPASFVTPEPPVSPAFRVIPGTLRPRPGPAVQPMPVEPQPGLASPLSAAAADSDTQPPAAAPVYATRLAPAATLVYSLRRGAAAGSAVLRWVPAGDRYELSLRGQVLAAPQVAWASQGAIDAHGIAPERYTESRRGRELRAANFQRDSQRITFSGPPVEHPLPPGAQDRLSWMLQLGAVLAAEPGLEAPGREVLLFVVGSRGDAEVWTFTVQGRQTIDLPGAGGISTVSLRRQPRRPYDTLVEVWLDPLRHHLPVRATLTVQTDSTEFVLEQLTLP